MIYMNKKGQALIEFILILPIFLLILFGIIDFGRILYNMNVLENLNNEIELMYKDGKNYNEMLDFVQSQIKTADLKISETENIEIIINNDIELITPGLGLIIDNPYTVNSKRILYK